MFLGERMWRSLYMLVSLVLTQKSIDNPFRGELGIKVNEILLESSTIVRIL